MIEKVDVAVIGGGAAGLGAAIKAREFGAKKVMIIERAEQLGGVLTQCIHNGFGLVYFKEDKTGPEYINWFIKKVEELEIKKKLESMVLGITPDLKIWGTGKEDGIFEVQAGAIVLAMGCRERTRGNIVIPGTRPAGIYTAGTAQRLVNIEGFMPGRRVVIIGSGDIGLIMARRFVLEGCKVEAAVEIMPFCGGLIRNEIQCLKDFNIPLYLSHATIAIKGTKRVEGVVIARVDENMKVIPGTEKEIPCDTVLLAVGLIPENELSISAGIELDMITKGPLVNERMECKIPGIFAAGNVVQVYDLVDHVTMAGEVAGEYAAAYVKGEYKESKYKVKAGENVRAIVPQLITDVDNDVVIRLRVSKPINKAEILVNNIKKKVVNGVRPSEMVSLKLQKDDLAKMIKEREVIEVGISVAG
jgi:NADPH-dependent 2,4-dienoyl-CoA reductase/sulfur reductase-like enzyme